MKNNRGMTLVSVVVMIVILAIIASLYILTTTKTVREAKKVQREENISIIRSFVAKVGTQRETAGYITPADIKIYGKQLDKVFLDGIFGEHESYKMIDGSNIEDWYLLENDDLEEMGITYLDEVYYVNYHTGEVYEKEEYMNKIKSIVSPST